MIKGIFDFKGEGADRVAKVFAARGVSEIALAELSRRPHPATVQEYLYRRLCQEADRLSGHAAGMLYFTALSLAHSDKGVIDKLAGTNDTVTFRDGSCSWNYIPFGPAHEVVAELFIERAVEYAKLGKWVDDKVSIHAALMLDLLSWVKLGGKDKEVTE